MSDQGSPTWTAAEESAMRRALELAASPGVPTGPNPRVGCVLLDDDGRTVAAMDVLAPGIGEIIGGSQREERLDVLDARLEEMNLDKADYWWYRDLRKYGTVPHAGFGLGFERTLIYATGMGNVRDVIPFPRTPRSAAF